MLEKLLNMCVDGKVQVRQNIDKRMVYFEGQLHVADSEFTMYDWFIRDKNVTIRFATKDVLGVLVERVGFSTSVFIRIKDKK